MINEKYYENGKLKSKGLITKNGLRINKWEEWYSNSQMECSIFYDIKEKLIGNYTEWYSNGQLYQKGYLNNKNKKHGNWTEFSNKGKVMYNDVYYNGIRYPPNLLPILQQKVRDKILLQKFKTLIKTEGFQKAWMDPKSFGGYWHKQRLLKDILFIRN